MDAIESEGSAQTGVGAPSERPSALIRLRPAALAVGVGEEELRRRIESEGVAVWSLTRGGETVPAIDLQDVRRLAGGAARGAPAPGTPGLLGASAAPADPRAEIDRERTAQEAALLRRRLEDESRARASIVEREVAARGVLGEVQSQLRRVREELAETRALTERITQAADSDRVDAAARIELLAGEAARTRALEVEAAALRDRAALLEIERDATFIKLRSAHGEQREQELLGQERTDELEVLNREVVDRLHYEIGKRRRFDQAAVDAQLELSARKAQIAERAGLLQTEVDAERERAAALDAQLQAAGERLAVAEGDYEQRIESLLADSGGETERVTQLEAELEGHRTDLADALTLAREQEEQLQHLWEERGELELKLSSKAADADALNEARARAGELEAELARTRASGSATAERDLAALRGQVEAERSRWRELERALRGELDELRQLESATRRRADRRETELEQALEALRATRTR